MSLLVDKMKAERDVQAALRRQAFANDDIVAANAHDALCGLLGEAIRDLEKSHVIIGVMKDVMMKRIIEAAVGEAYRERLE